MNLPTTENTPLIRTDFASDEAWREVVRVATQPYEDGFVANLSLVDDRAFDGADPRTLAELAGRARWHAVLVIADAATMADPEHTLLCIDALHDGAPFRIIPSELWGVENNLSLANMDYEDFASSCDADGVFRGFAE
jgi:hypothetical protein